MWAKKLRDLDVRIDHFLLYIFLPFLNLGCGSRPRAANAMSRFAVHHF